MLNDYEQKTGDDGLLRTHFTEPGQGFLFYTWEIADPDTGDAVSIRAIQQDDVRLGDLPFARAVAFLTLAVFGTTLSTAFELDGGGLHRFARSGWCPNPRHNYCSYDAMPRAQAEAIWAKLRDYFHPTDEHVWDLLADEFGQGFEH